MLPHYRLKSEHTFPCTAGRLSFAIIHPPFKDRHIRITPQPDRLGLGVIESPTPNFIYQTVNALTRLNLHQPAKKVFEKTVLDESYTYYISNNFHQTTQRCPVLTMGKTQFMKLYRRLMSECLYTTKEITYSPTPEEVRSIQSMIFRATDFFIQNRFIESNMDMSGGYSKHIRGGIGDYLCEDGIFALRTSTTNNGLKLALTHVLIQTLLCQKSDEYRDFPFQRIGVYNAFLNTAYEYNLDDVDEGFIEFILDIRKRGKEPNERIEILSQ